MIDLLSHNDEYECVVVHLHGKTAANITPLRSSAFLIDRIHYPCDDVVNLFPGRLMVDPADGAKKSLR